MLTTFKPFEIRGVNPNNDAEVAALDAAAARRQAGEDALIQSRIAADPEDAQGQIETILPTPPVAPLPGFPDQRGQFDQPLPDNSGQVVDQGPEVLIPAKIDTSSTGGQVPNIELPNVLMSEGGSEIKTGPRVRPQDLELVLGNLPDDQFGEAINDILRGDNVEVTDIQRNDAGRKRTINVEVESDDLEEQMNSDIRELERQFGPSRNVGSGKRVIEVSENQTITIRPTSDTGPPTINIQVKEDERVVDDYKFRYR